MTYNAQRKSSNSAELAQITNRDGIIVPAERPGPWSAWKHEFEMTVAHWREDLGGAKRKTMRRRQPEADVLPDEVPVNFPFVCVLQG